MKNAIKLTALCMLLSSGLFAAVSSNPTSPKAAVKKDMVMFSPLHAKRGIDVRIRKITPGKAIVMIYDADKDYWKDVIKKPAFEKGYILNQLDEGDYTVEVTMPSHQVIKRAIHVYDQGANRCVRISKAI
ncbi:MAG TPA: hypothetical protein VGI43_15170 [Mucilaginibacter sp.]|jgi:hypothetical protein